MPDVLLDLTRLTSRLGRGAMTGIDRVEAAYLEHVLAQPMGLHGLVRTRLGFLLLDRAGCAALAEFAADRMPVPDLPLWLRHLAKPVARGTWAMRRLAVAARPRAGLGGLLARVPKGARYINVGHSNLSADLFWAIQRAGLPSAVMIHDTIPLDYPAFARQGTVAPFAKKIRATALMADAVIHISADARRKTEAHFAAAGRVPAGITAHLGLRLAAPTPAPIVPARSYFVALGTIEPRKNLAMLLDIWDQMGPDDPQLVIIGAKGWAAPALFDQMARLQSRGTVLHGENLTDGAVVSLLSGARALLFPSLAEGFGLPPIEAAALGIPVIAADLPVLHETCGRFPVYLSPLDSYCWLETIKGLTTTDLRHKNRQDAPDWADHFQKVFTHLA